MNAERSYCLDCRWCQVRIDFNGRSNYVCLKDGRNLSSAVLWRVACGDFVPVGAAAG